MSADLGKLAEARVEIRATLDKLDADLKNARAGVQSSMSKTRGIITQGMRGIEGAIGRVTGTILNLKTLLLGLGVGITFKKMIGVWEEQENVAAQLNATLKSTGGAAGLTSKQLLDLASSTQKVTRYDDEAIAGAESLLLTFTSIGRDVFPDAIKTILDMSTALGHDLQGSVMVVGKALQDPILGTQLLRRQGIIFTESQTEMIKSLTQSGQLLEAQGIILDALQVKFGGSARAARDTMGGALEALRNTIENLIEDMGEGGLIDLVRAIATEFEKMASGMSGKKLGERITEGLLEGLQGTSNILERIGPTVDMLVDIPITAYHGWKRLPPLIQDWGLIGALLGGKRIIQVLALTSWLGEKVFGPLGETLGTWDVGERFNELMVGLEEVNKQIEKMETLRADLQGQGVTLPNKWLFDDEALNQLKRQRETMQSEMESLEQLLTDIQSGKVQPDLPWPFSVFTTGFEENSDIEKEESRLGSFADAIRKFAGDVSAIMGDIAKKRELENWAEQMTDFWIGVTPPPKVDAGLVKLSEIMSELQTKLDIINRQSELFSKEFDMLPAKANAFKEALDKIAEAGDLIPISEEQVQKILAQYQELLLKLTPIRELRDSVRQFGDDLARTFADIAFGAETSFSDIAQSFAKMLLEMAIRQAAIAPLSNLFSGLFSGGGTATNFNAAMPHELASGGQLSAGRLALVGEQGPELFMSRSAGTVIPNSALRDLGSETTVQIYNTTGQPATVEKGKGADGKELIRVLVGENAKDVYQHGSLAQALEMVYGLRRGGR